MPGGGAAISGPVDLSVFDPAVAESPLKTAEAELARANKEIAALLKERKSLKAQVARLQKSGG